MSPISSDQEDPVAWARRVNKGWIVHHGLKESTEDYLNYLEAAHPRRLSHSCRRANQMVEAREVDQDPKPWFYAGLFSLATPEEAERFLDKHWFTASCIPSLSTTAHETSKEPGHLGTDTQKKLESIRCVLTRLEQGY